MSVNSVMTALADAVRAKSGQSGALTIEQMTEGLNNIPIEAEKIITPSTESQTVITNGTYAIGDIVVAGDENLISQNIKQGVNIFGVEGNYDPKEDGEGSSASYPINLTYSGLYMGRVFCHESSKTIRTYDLLYGPEPMVYAIANSELIIIGSGSGDSLPSVSVTGDIEVLYEGAVYDEAMDFIFIFLVSGSGSIAISDAEEL